MLANPADYKLHASPLLRFEDNFSPLIEQCNNIVITYDYSFPLTDQGPNDRLDVISVNNCSTPEELRKWLTNLIEPLLDNLYNQLKKVHPMYWDSHFTYISDKFEQLTMIAEDERFIFNGGEFCPNRRHHFKSFTNCRMVGPRSADHLMFGQYIRFKAVRFTEVWLEVLFGTIDRLDLIHKLLIQSIEGAEKPPPKMKASYEEDFNIKSNFTVPQLGIFFKLMVAVKIIVVPNRQIVLLIHWIIKHIQSKSREVIKFDSLRNKFFTWDLGSLDYIEKKLNEMIILIQNERNRLTK